MTQKPSKQLTGKEPQSHPAMKNRYKEGTNKCQIAEALLAGEVDMGKVGKVVDVSLTTIDNTASSLTRLGIPLAIHQIPQVATTSTTLPTTSTHQRPPQVSSNNSPGGPTHPMATGEIDQVAQRLYEIMQGKSPQERSEGYR
jgi:hypothetical protein